MLLFPSSRGGVDATSKNIAEGTLQIVANGVVRNVFDHPVCALKVASQLLLIAQPPLLWRRGIAACPTVSSFGQHALSPAFNSFTRSTTTGRSLRTRVKNVSFGSSPPHEAIP